MLPSKAPWSKLTWAWYAAVVSTTVHYLGQSNRRDRPVFLRIYFNNLGGPGMTPGPSNRIIPLRRARPLIPGEVTRISHGLLGTTHMG